MEKPSITEESPLGKLFKLLAIFPKFVVEHVRDTVYHPRSDLPLIYAT